MQLNAKRIGFRYTNETWLFRGVDLTIESGEIVGLKGSSGSGKSTLCRILAGYENLYEGQITLNESPLSNKNEYCPVQLVFQHPEKAINPKWKMERILNEGFKPEQELLDLFGIQREWLTRWPNELSGGELQRFCLVRALGPATKFLIVDEMTTMLDSITQAQIWHAVLKIAKERKMGILVVSHEQKLIQKVCDRAIDFNLLKENIK